MNFFKLLCTFYY